MDYTTKSYHSADCDPGDCNYDNTEEYGAEFSVEAAEEFTPYPETAEVGYNYDTEVSQDYDPTLEQAATYDDNDEYSYLTTDMYDAENSSEYTQDRAENTSDNSEISEDLTDNTENTTDSVENTYTTATTDTTDYTTDTTDYTATENYDSSPSDETAATIDEWYNADKPSARERCELDDYEIISDVLGSEKQLVKLYSTALCEASEEPFRNLIKENLDSTASDQYKAYEFMHSRGMYPTEQASEQDISQAKQQFGPLCRNCSCKECECD